MRLFEQGKIDDVEPAEKAVDDGPKDRVIVGVGNCDRQGRAKAHPVFRPFEADAVSSPSVHLVSPRLAGGVNDFGFVTGHSRPE